MLALADDTTLAFIYQASLLQFACFADVTSIAFIAPVTIAAAIVAVGLAVVAMYATGAIRPKGAGARRGAASRISRGGAGE